MKRDLVNKVWVLLVFITAGIAFGFSVLALMGVFTYLKFDTETAAFVHTFKVDEEGPSRYVISGYYSYTVNGKDYNGETLFDRVCYLNRSSAEKDLTKWREMGWDAWYNSKKPEESTLQKMFPFKKCLYALLTLGVFIYFLILRYFTFSRSMWKNDL